MILEVVYSLNNICCTKPQLKVRSYTDPFLKNPKDPKKKKRNAAVDQMVFSCVSITEIDVLMKLHINYL